MLTGDVPSPVDPPSGCRFHPRCPKAQTRCSARNRILCPGPGTRDHLTACHFPVEAGDDLARPPPPRRTDSSPPSAPDRVPGGPMTVTDPGQAMPMRSAAGPAPGRSPAARLGAAAARQGRDRLGVTMVLIAVAALAAPLIAHGVGHEPEDQYRDTGLTPGGCRSARTGPSCSAPTTSAATCWSGSSTARASRCSSAWSPPAGGRRRRRRRAAGRLLRRPVDTVLSRLMDVVLSFPFLLFAIALVSVVGPA